MKLDGIRVDIEGPYSLELAEIALVKNSYGYKYSFQGTGRTIASAAVSAVNQIGHDFPTELITEVTDYVEKHLPAYAGRDQADGETHFVYVTIRLDVEA